ncbi:hypothetical protein CONPUDRAFT_142109 [Coniophora puteana RWD-64-598 SS2]|uniref:DUF6593 domain-containing protein n=1 Tax=Coniophora puteana (strain RWD-64-598) TaxID=741705 RepID=A0A5M3N2S4_CONPW|nr:uncharacterized protein CONPUDRAFT_142109 [Coniophora puteana RWD-64-598 SS2]EIW85616.1 hypothetical protein CONPUDRAFT_142109 [Coniophora puteana RWD-64-598 SS2]
MSLPSPSSSSSSSPSSPSSTEPFRLTFTTPSLRNTVLADASDTFYYDISTPEWAPCDTNIRRLPVPGSARESQSRFEQVARVRLHHGRAVGLAMYGWEWGDVNKFVWEARPQAQAETEKGPGGEESGWEFEDDDWNVFRWEVVGQRLELRRVRKDSGRSSANEPPVATFHRHKRFMMVGTVSQPATLDVDPAALGSLDSIVVALLIVESFRRH